AVIEGIELKLIDQRTGNVVDYDKIPNLYGDGVETLVFVTVSGNDRQKSAQIELQMHGLKYTDEATGSHPKVVNVFTRPLTSGYPKSRRFGFVTSYMCYPKVVIAARLVERGKGKKKQLGKKFSRTVNMACSE
ncbi:MAG: hypothetical protein ACI9OJ_002378, partial [Myxococcota bacterium]